MSSALSLEREKRRGNLNDSNITFTLKPALTSSAAKVELVTTFFMSIKQGTIITGPSVKTKSPFNVPYMHSID